MKTFIGHKIDAQSIDNLIDLIEKIAEQDDCFYVGYPVVTTLDSSINVPALLVSKRFGLVCFDIIPVATPEKLIEIKSSQKNLMLALKIKLMNNPNLVDDEGNLAFKIETLTFTTTPIPQDLNGFILNESSVGAKILSFSPIQESLYPIVNSTIERVANIKPKIKRQTNKPNSKGSIIKKIESEIANLDSWQKAAAIETPNGPQRIRGLAGSGKTIVLALKAAYLHGKHPEWKICVTFHTRSLTDQMNKLINRFYYEDYKDEPNREKLIIMHSFGSNQMMGVYSEICSVYGIQPRTFDYGKRTFGYSQAFGGICKELLSIVERSPKIIYDAILIDEAQDLPKEFLRLAFLCTRNHRVVWAYDDLQNLSEYQMTSLKETFGEDSNNLPLVKLENHTKEPRQDIILPKCYRNTPYALVTAHALGTGIYREHNLLVQHPDDPILWDDIGYEAKSGGLNLGESVILKRKDDASPQFFSELINSNDAIDFIRLPSKIQNLLNLSHEILSAYRPIPHTVQTLHGCQPRDFWPDVRRFTATRSQQEEVWPTVQTLSGRSNLDGLDVLA